LLKVKGSANPGGGARVEGVLKAGGPGAGRGTGKSILTPPCIVEKVVGIFREIRKQIPISSLANHSWILIGSTTPYKSMEG
jgi:hypothetical protein